MNGTMDDGLDDGLDDRTPVIDPATDAQVRDLLAATPDPGPMPPEVATRITAALGDENLARIDSPTAVSPTGVATPISAAEAYARRRQGDHDALGPLLHRHRRPSPLLAVAATAAAAAVVAVGGSALHVTKRMDGTAALSDASGQTTSTTPAPTTTTSTTTTTITTPVTPVDSPHIQTSATTYTPQTLPAQARELLTRPSLALTTGAAEAPSLGPIATPRGLQGCLSALGTPDPASVSVDLALWNETPAAVIVVTDDTGSSTAYVVQRACQAGDAQVIAPATPVP